jgi:hypothetical protein
MYICIYTHIYIYIYVHIYVYVYISICVHVLYGMCDQPEDAQQAYGNVEIHHIK